MTSSDPSSRSKFKILLRSKQGIKGLSSLNLNKFDQDCEISSDSTDATPTQSFFSQPIDLARSQKRDTNLRHSILRPEDSEGTKKKLREIMARIDDVFDVEEWDADQHSNAPDNSPEPLTAKVQPLAYTTVGSLVKSNAIPQFTAPVRIQREGASRRPPPSSAQSRGYDNYPAVRGTNVQLSMGYQSSYPPQRGTNFSHQHQKSHSYVDLSEAEEKLLRSLGVSSPPTRGGTMEEGKEIFYQDLTGSNPSIYPDNLPAALHGMDLKANQLTGERTAASQNLQNLLKDQPVHQPIVANSFMSNLRMQSLINLSQYPNRDQQAAKDQLEFAAAKVQNTGIAGSGLAVQQPAKFGAPNLPPKTRDTLTLSKADGEEQRIAFNSPYEFPPPGLIHPSKQDFQSTSHGNSQGNPFNISTDQLDQEKQAYLLSGRPFPLTAGPPGQRQNISRPKLPAVTSFRNLQAGDRSQQATTLPPNSPWGPHNPQNMFISTPRPGTEIRDTLSLAEAAKYYPNGFPDDMKGNYTRLNTLEKQRMLGPIGPPGGTEREKQRKEYEMWKQDQWWYHGVRRFDMTAEDHLCRLEKREYERSSGQGPQPTPSPGPISKRLTFTTSEVTEMSPSKAAAPLLDGLFGTLLDYADATVTPTSRKVMSKLATPPAWQIDHGENGNVSFFGNKCGSQPKRLSCDQKSRPS